MKIIHHANGHEYNVGIPSFSYYTFLGLVVCVLVHYGLCVSTIHL